MTDQRGVWNFGPRALGKTPWPHKGETSAVSNMPVQASGGCFAALAPLAHSDWGASTQISQRAS